MHTSSAFFEQPTPFPHISFRCIFTTHFIILLVNFRRMNQLRFTGSGIFYLFFLLISSGYSEWGENYDRMLRSIRVHSGIGKTIGLHRKCARHLLGCYGPSTLNKRASCIRECSNLYSSSCINMGSEACVG